MKKDGIEYDGKGWCGIRWEQFVNKSFFFQSFLLEIEFLQSKGETVFDKLTSLPGVEREHKQSSPVIPLLLSSPPSIPTILKPLKDRLSDVNAAAVHIWITDVSLSRVVRCPISAEGSLTIVYHIIPYHAIPYHTPHHTVLYHAISHTPPYHTTHHTTPLTCES